MFGLTKNHRGNVYKSGKMLPVLDAPVLLASRKHQSLIEHLQSLSGMSEEHFKVSYHILVRRFAEYVQVLPTSLDHKLCSLLNHSLSRAAGVLRYYVGKNSESDPLKRFALFSALLLREVSCVFNKYNVIVVDEEGKHLHYWDPMQGPMTQYEEDTLFYKLLPLPVDHSRLEGPLSVMIAPELMSSATYEWLTSDRTVFVDWLDIMLSTGMKGAELSYFYALFIEDELEHGFDFDELDDLDIDFEDAPESELADKFLEWLNAAIDNNELAVAGTDPECHVLHSGLFIESRVLEKFAQLYKFPNTLVTYNIGNLFGIAKKGGNDFRFDQFSKGSAMSSLVNRGKSRVTGVYLSDRFVKRAGASLSHIQLMKANSAVSLPSLKESVRYARSMSNTPPK